ncbi:hypothetical protein [Lentibacillus salicampi]|uniref:Uncharacterized protein n=1 Tax=Lentibacillus salicampi TaxID=175306 RepID=A0A4Y9A8J6_9BACI|nr:hypothetical protein [Lentibacillus salicampi]TFJ92156.1 hypothetical protein E4U82_13840 [Lentibacillus salicampi]
MSEQLKAIKWNYVHGYDFNPGSAEDQSIQEDFEWLIQQSERTEQLESENERMREVLKDFANNGTKHDLNPTLVMDGKEYFQLLDYIKNMDGYVRNTAKQALRGDTD